MAILQPGSFGDEVRNWQLFLTKYGFYLDPIDAFFGASTKVSTATFQVANNLSPDGIVKDKTLEIAVKLGFSLSGPSTWNLNKSPIANAGPDQTISLTGNNNVVVLNASGSADSDGVLVAFNWRLVSGPNFSTISNPSSPQTTVINLVEGTYIFELTVTDDRGASAKDTVQVTAISAENKSPIANAGVDQTIALTGNNDVLILDGSGSVDPDGVLVAINWRLVSGPNFPTISNPSSTQTTVTNLVAGTYIFELTVTDDRGISAKDTVEVTTIAAENKSPIANAGPDQTISLRGNNDVLILDGSGSIDPDGVLFGFSWRLVSGPTSIVILNPNSSQTFVKNLNPGTYIFELTVTDDRGASAKDTVQINAVAGVNKAPIANAGRDQQMSISASINGVILNGNQSSGPEGGPLVFEWKLLTGPQTPLIISPNSSQTIITGFVPGVYIFELIVTDNRGASAKDTVQITITPAQNKSPIANAGIDQVIKLSSVNNTVKLDGSNSKDPEGSVIRFSWRLISGQGRTLIKSPNAAQTNVTGFREGVYRFELTVTDYKGATSKDTVQVTVKK